MILKADPNNHQLLARIVVTQLALAVVIKAQGLQNLVSSNLEQFDALTIVQSERTEKETREFTEMIRTMANEFSTLITE